MLQRLSGYLPRLIPVLVLVRVFGGGGLGVEHAVQRGRAGFAERGRVCAVRRGRRASVRVSARERRQVEREGGVEGKELGAGRRSGHVDAAKGVGVGAGLSEQRVQRGRAGDYRAVAVGEGENAA